MSPRPVTPPGAYGQISYEHIGPSRYRARARYRDVDGVLRRVSRYGQTQKAARKALVAALDERVLESGIGLKSDTLVRDLADVWLIDVEASNRASGTKEQYTDAVRRYVKPALGGYRIREVTTSVCDRAIGALVAKHGPSAAKTAKSVLNGMFGLAVRHDAAMVNPVRECRSIPRVKPVPRALTAKQQADITDALRASERATDLDLPDLVEFMLATGCRIGEALAVRYEDINFQTGTVSINATIVRLRGKGLERLPPKTASSNRLLKLPTWAVEMLRARRDVVRRTRDTNVVFPSPAAGTLRDPHNTAGDLRELRDQLGYPWLTFHTFRKTVADRLDEAGLNGRDVANQLGHARPSITQDVYLSRRVLNDAAAKVLDR